MDMATALDFHTTLTITLPPILAFSPLNLSLHHISLTIWFFNLHFLLAMNLPIQSIPILPLRETHVLLPKRSSLPNLSGSTNCSVYPTSFTTGFLFRKSSPMSFCSKLFPTFSSIRINVSVFILRYMILLNLSLFRVIDWMSHHLLLQVALQNYVNKNCIILA